jgi:hypothetical protein
MRTLTVAASAAALALMFSGCSGGSDEGKTPGTIAARSAADTSAEHVDKVGGQAVAFGEPYEYADGLIIMIGEPEEFTPSPSAVTGDEPEYIKFKVELVNNTDQPVSPTSVFVTVESGGGAGGDVVDRAQKLRKPAKALAPNAQVSWMQGFGVLDSDDVAAVVQAGMKRVPVAFIATS